MVKRMKECSECDGKGNWLERETNGSVVKITCSDCAGTGFVEAGLANVTVRVDIDREKLQEIVLNSMDEWAEFEVVGAGE